MLSTAVDPSHGICFYFLPTLVPVARGFTWLPGLRVRTGYDQNYHTRPLWRLHLPSALDLLMQDSGTIQPDARLALRFSEDNMNSKSSNNKVVALQLAHFSHRQNIAIDIEEKIPIIAEDVQ
ncbi:hypothetical protein C8J56DRAFT_1039478 [Mycena floridula]|nr:hypothetical protein C8J56DRAFT_1039478 [Mycena floridula]